MFVTVLGSGGSEGVPVPYCNCKVCKSGDKRYRTSYLIETKERRILVEISPDFRKQQLNHNFSIDYLFISHEHYDHVGGLPDLRNIMLVAKIKIKPIKLLISKRLHKKLLHQPYIVREGIRYFYNTLVRHKKLLPMIMDYGKKYAFSDFQIQLFRNRHGRISCDGFLLESEGKSLVYLGDAGSLYQKTESLINDSCPDLLIANTPYFYSNKKITKGSRSTAKRLWITHHLGIDTISHLCAKKILLSHFSHRSGLTHEEIENLVSEYKNVIAAKDGMKIRV